MIRQDSKLFNGIEFSVSALINYEFHKGSVISKGLWNSVYNSEKKISCVLG